MNKQTEKVSPIGYIWSTTMHPTFRFTQQFIEGEEGVPVYTVPKLQVPPKLSAIDIRNVSDSCDEGQEDMEYLIAFGMAIEKEVRKQFGVKDE